MATERQRSEWDRTVQISSILIQANSKRGKAPDISKLHPYYDDLESTPSSSGSRMEWDNFVRNYCKSAK